MKTAEERWKDGYTIQNCMKQMTSKEGTELAIKELIEYHVEAALETAANKVKKLDYTTKVMIVDEESILNAYPKSKIL